METYVIILILIACGALIAAVAAFLRFQNNRIIVSERTYTSVRLPKSFDGVRIAQISDLHNHLFGRDQSRLMEKLRLASPDYVMISGDLIDKRRTDMNDIDNAVTLVRQLSDIAPVLFAPGNHESVSPVYDYLREKLIEYGAELLENRLIRIERGGDTIAVTGVEDIAFLGEKTELHKDEFRDILSGLRAEKDEFNILISHRPDLLDMYSELGFDLVFSGHAHGGQFRFPLIGGIYSPHQGLFPKYTCGFYRKGDTTELVSRGLGNSRFPFRLFNYPELNVVTLKC